MWTRCWSATNNRSSHSKVHIRSSAENNGKCNEKFIWTTEFYNKDNGAICKQYEGGSEPKSKRQYGEKKHNSWIEDPLAKWTVGKLKAAW